MAQQVFHWWKDAVFFYKAGLKFGLTWPEKIIRGDPFAQKFGNQNAPHPTR